MRCNGVCLELYARFDFQPITFSTLLFFSTLTHLKMVDKQTYFEKHHHEKYLYHQNNLNQTFEVAQF